MACNFRFQLRKPLCVEINFKIMNLVKLYFAIIISLLTLISYSYFISYNERREIQRSLQEDRRIFIKSIINDTMKNTFTFLFMANCLNLQNITLDLIAITSRGEERPDLKKLENIGISCHNENPCQYGSFSAEVSTYNLE